MRKLLQCSFERSRIGQSLRIVDESASDLLAMTFVVERNYGTCLGEEVYAEHGYYHGSSPYGSVPGEVVVEEWVNAVPDKHTRGHAKKILKSMYSSSKYYCVRYAAGRALGKWFLGRRVNRWASALEQAYQNVTSRDNTTSQEGTDSRSDDIIADAHRLSLLVQQDDRRCRSLEALLERISADFQDRRACAPVEVGIAVPVEVNTDRFNRNAIKQDLGEYRQYCHEFYGIKTRRRLDGGSSAWLKH